MQTGFDVKFYTIMDIILWVESAREIHKNIFGNFCIIMELLFCAIIILFCLFPFLDYYYKFCHFEMQTAKAIPIDYRGDAPRGALKFDYPLLKLTSGYQEQINT